FMTLTATHSIATAALRPQPGEFAPYYDRYISLVHPDQTSGIDILATFDDQRRQMLLLLSGRPETDGDLRYAPGKWSLKDVLGHINDTERIMSYRALRISRGDQTPIEGFEQDDYVRNAPFAQLSLPDLIEDYIAVRRATISLFRNLDEAAWTRRGVASKNEVTVRALAYIIAGHELHHRKIIEEKYLK
ncbi:MAG: DinB family protein, partial [Terriglobales bacterium]